MSLEKKLFDKALDYLQRRDYSEKELWQKLSLKFPESKQEITAVLNELKQKKYLHNERFLESRVRHRLQQGYGPIKIINELETHGFDRAAITHQINIESNETASPLKALILKKYKQINAEDPAAVQKLIQYCLRRGFAFQEIRQALRDVNVQADNDALA